MRRQILLLADLVVSASDWPVRVASVWGGMRVLWFVLIVLLCLPAWAEAATINAASCSQADVRTAVRAAANSGDTVLIPAGTCVWNGFATAGGGSGGLGSYCGLGGLYEDSLCRSGATTYGDTKYVTISGQPCTLDGNGRPTSCPTIITDNVSKSADPPQAIMWKTRAGGLQRITNIEFRSQANCGGNGQTGSINIQQNGDQFRADHNRFIASSLNTCDVFVVGNPLSGDYLRGVIDHNFFDCSGVTVCTYTNNGSSWGNVGTLGDNSWAVADTIGTSEAIYYEDNWLYNSGANYPTLAVNPFAGDGEYGSRVVFRHNLVTNLSFGQHGNDSVYRGARQMEIYKNTWTRVLLQSDSSIASMRGGVSTVFGNTATYTGTGSITNGFFEGSNIRDNFSETNNTVYGPLCNGSGLHDQNTVGQTGYRCIDQVGNSYGRYFNSTTNSPLTGWVGVIDQGSQPTHCWSNTLNGSASNCGGNGIHVLVGRDVLNTVRPLRGDGLAYCTDGNNCLTTDPYTYPHPLAVAGSDITPPSAPTGVTIVKREAKRMVH